LRDHGVPAARVGLVHAAIVDALLRRALALAALETTEAPEPVRQSWILLGSMARREPLPRSDLDTALLWEDAAQDAEAVRKHAARVLDIMARCGLQPCPNGANASNPLFGRSQSDWHAATRAWAHDPTREGALLLSAMVTDSRPVTELELGHHLTDAMRTHTRTSQFLRALLDEALAWRPARGVVRDFVVPWRGEHRGQLDLKRSGLAPVVALGRWIAIVTADASGTTPDRLRRGAEAGLLTADERDTLVVGFDSVYTLLLDRELDAIRQGRPATTFVRPHELGSLARRHLSETFRAVDAVQTKVDNVWLRRLAAQTR
jgi:CBS domain-containing protein